MGISGEAVMVSPASTIEKGVSDIWLGDRVDVVRSSLYSGRIASRHQTGSPAAETCHCL
jgi:hypothetical protein